MRLFDLHGKNAIVTGGARGLGKFIALGLAEAGANVSITSRNEKELIETCKEIESFSSESYYEAIDIQNQTDFKSFVERVNDKFGSIDILVNAAGLNKEILS